MIQPTMPAKLTSGSVSTTSNTPRHASRAALAYSGMKSVECTRQRCAGGRAGGMLRGQDGVCAGAKRTYDPTGGWG